VGSYVCLPLLDQRDTTEARSGVWPSGSPLGVTAVGAALFLPLLLLGAALGGLHEVLGARGATVSALWMATASVAAWWWLSRGAGDTRPAATNPAVAGAHVAVAGWPAPSASSCSSPTRTSSASRFSPSTPPSPCSSCG
jgi:hypothetical protein